MKKEALLGTATVFDLVIVNKAIRLREEDVLADDPLGTGDFFAIKES
ncbi:MAG: hypothetical protein ACLS7V_08855 [Enterococcus durans]